MRVPLPRWVLLTPTLPLLMLLGTGVAEAQVVEAQVVEAQVVEAQVAEAQSAPEPPAVPFGDAVPVPDIKQRLDEAVRAYQVGQREEARRLLVELVLAPPPGDPTLLLEARVYLGELLYTEGDEEGARRFFEQVLQIDPLYIIDPFRHPPDITSFFDYIRLYEAQAASAQTSPPPPTVLPRAPIGAWAPLGIYQLRHGRTGMGALWLGGQLTMVGLNTVSFVMLASDRRYLTGDADAERRLRTLKGLSLGSTIGFYATWTAGVADAHGHWRRQGAAEAARRAPPDGGSTR